VVDDVFAMTTPYKYGNGKSGTGSEVAKNWLDALQRATRFSDVEVLPYANADSGFLQRFAPSELRFYCSAAQSKLEKILMRSVLPCAITATSPTQISISQSLVDSYTMIRKETALLKLLLQMVRLINFVWNKLKSLRLALVRITGA
jgi:hypothetical protein